MTVLLVQGPGYALVQRLNGCVDLFGDVAHDGVDHLAFVVSLLAFDDILGGNTTLGKIDVTYSKF